MRVGLHDSEKEHMKRKSFPNLALMKLSAYHRARGDEVRWWCPLDGCDYDVVKVVFKFADEHKALTAFITENSQQRDDARLVAL